jgi:hypothetical protein
MNRFLSKVLPGYGKRALRVTRRKHVANITTLSEQIFEQIQRDPRFHKQFA